MGDILKEAIADAKAVRETALQNAKMALEEAFTPQLKSMLSAKLREEDDEFEGEEEVPAEEQEDELGAEEVPAEEQEDEFGGEEEVPAEEGTYEEDEEEFGGEEEGEFGGEEEVPAEEDEEGELDLESIIRELESELSEEEGEEEGEAVEESEEAVEESDEPVEEEYEIDESLFTEDDDEDDDDDDEEVEESADNSELEALQSELKEYKSAVHFLKDKLHEVNILNAKLLFTNKLFKEYSLNNNQKLKVVETFDRAQSTREIKLVYSTLAEQFSDNGSITKKHSIKESASSVVGSTKPSKGSRKVISEEKQVANRFKKLAGIL
jgi:hypothetical protein